MTPNPLRTKQKPTLQDYLGWSLDFTGPQMILTIKLSSFAYNVYDGTEDRDVIATPQVGDVMACMGVCISFL